MASGRRAHGICHICGKEGKLSFEHVPPRNAYNTKPVVSHNFEQAIRLMEGENCKGTLLQKGSGKYTLCPTCNNNTGGWYGSCFIDWSFAGMKLLMESRGHPSGTHVFRLRPLAVLKQIAAMMFSVNATYFQVEHPDLVNFVLNKEATHLSPDYRFFVYFSTTEIYRMCGRSIQGRFSHDLSRMTTFDLSEIAFVPFGYTMTYKSDPPENRLCEITLFADFAYNEYREIALDIPLLPVYTIFPGDYRAPDQIREDMAKGLAAQRPTP